VGVAERKARDRAERHARITAAARQIAERDGWGAVTVRRLADEIEFSQPVLYSHFDNRDAIVTAVAVEGFSELTSALEQAGEGAEPGRAAIHKAATTYLAFAREHPAVYEAMFTLPTSLRFGGADSDPGLRAALAAVLRPTGGDVDVATELFWAALHGLSELERSGRIRPSARDERVARLVDGLVQP
jgi:AcrR family transcriptional regulator